MCEERAGLGEEVEAEQLRMDSLEAEESALLQQSCSDDTSPL